MTVRLDYPGLMKERLPSGGWRWRVRPEGRKSVKITLAVTPDHPQFREHYFAARAGIKLGPEPDAPKAIRGSIGWLVDLYLAAMPTLGLHPATIHQRKMFLTWLRGEVGEYDANMPQSEVIKLQDKKAATPGAADNFVKAVRAMYGWGMQRGHVRTNPAAGIAKTSRGTGARPWTLDDLTAYRTRHPRGTMAHLCLSLMMFTAARIGDVYQLGRQHEVTRDGLTWLDFTPAKKGSRRVQIPIAPPLAAAIKAVKVAGPGPYLLTDYGRPFASAKALANKFAGWVEQAGLAGLSSHGIRKAAGELLALQGASEYHVMAVHGHASARTSGIYTNGVNRARLGQQAMGMLAGMEW